MQTYICNKHKKGAHFTVNAFLILTDTYINLANISLNVVLGRIASNAAASFGWK